MKRILDSILEWIEYGRRDMHMLAGCSITAITVALGFYCSSQLWIISLISVLLSFLLSIGKEIYDKYIKKTFFDYTDIIASVIPSLVVLVLVALSYII